MTDIKTIKQISLECGIDRTTLNKAIRRGAIDATLYGKTYVIDTDSATFKRWLISRKRPNLQASPS